MLPDLVAGHRRSRPQVRVDLQEMTTEQQVPALLEGRVDVGLGRDLEPSAGLSVVAVRRERLVLAVPRDHPLHRRRRVNLRELRDDPLMHPDSP